MTDENKNPIPIPVAPGEILHVLAGGILAFGIAWRRGDTFTLTPEMVASTVDLAGHTWLDDLSEAAQVRRWGAPRFGIGPWPEDLHSWLPGTRDQAEARETARLAAHRLEDPRERMHALREVERTYGSQSTSKTINSAPDPSARLAQGQRDRLDAGGVRVRSSYAPGRRVNP